eukprot:508254-Amphidinium_carterae.1
MAAPTVAHLALAERMGRYLLHRPRVGTLYNWQPMPSELKVQCDADHAGNVVKRTSTSGWCAFQ